MPASYQPVWTSPIFRTFSISALREQPAETIASRKRTVRRMPTLDTNSWTTESGAARRRTKRPGAGLVLGDLHPLECLFAGDALGPQRGQIASFDAQHNRQKVVAVGGHEPI